MAHGFAARGNPRRAADRPNARARSGVITPNNVFPRRLATGSDILDRMSSYASHLPTEAVYGRVVGLGMNLRELEQNEQLSERHVHNLNTHPVMPFVRRAHSPTCGRAPA